MNRNMKIIIMAFTLSSAVALGQGRQGGGRDGGGKPPQMDEATKAAFEACATENNIPKPESGTRPSREQHEKLKACLKAKGIEMPKHGPGGKGGERPPPRHDDEDSESTSESSSTSSSSSSGGASQ